MRHPIAIALTAGLLSCLLPSAAPAQELKVRIDDVRLGFQAGSEEPRCKAGAWAPVYVDLTALNRPQGTNPRELVLVVETTDSDGVQNRYRTYVPALQDDKREMVVTYVRPGNVGSETTVSVRSADERKTYQSIRLNRYAQSPETILYLVAGSRLPRMKTVLLGKPPAGDDEEVRDDGLRRFGYADQVEKLPTRWFGYQAVDLMILTSGRRAFIEELAESRLDCRDALVEWVRRGGQLVISVGQNHQSVTKLLEKTGLIACEIRGTVRRPGLNLHPWIPHGSHHTQKFEGAGIEVAQLKVRPGVDVLAERNAKGDVELPLIVQAPFGLGRVVLVAFDLDVAPFTRWAGQEEFYNQLKSELEPRHVEQANQQNFSRRGYGTSNELAGSLQSILETPDDITPVSFGWVALFILLYIIVVGPLDYLFLKKVVKRLELTWITFPVVVIVVSTLAYFTAYYLKGNDLKITKVDVVDIDLHQSRIYGHNWFALFSPRIQNYTVGVEPAFTAAQGKSPWVAEPPRDPTSGEQDPSGAYATAVDWMGRPERFHGGSGSSGGQGLFRRTYDYMPDLSGLNGVPIQVWATKSFTSSWHAPRTATHKLFEAKLEHLPGKRDEVQGTITSHLPVPLQDVAVLYREYAYRVGNLAPGEEVRLEGLGKQSGAGARQGGSMTLTDWFKPWKDEFDYMPQQRQYGLYEGPDGSGWSHSSVAVLMRSVLFNKMDQGTGWQNSGLRHLDQSWRLKRTNEVVVWGRIAPAQPGSAEDVTTDVVSPSRLWLGDLPGPKKTRPSLAGRLSQRTYVRVFIPVTEQKE